MAIASRSSPRDAPRLSLTRDNKASPQKNSRKEIRPPREISIPWAGIAGFFVSAGILCILLLFIAGVSFGLLYSYRYVTSNAYFALKTLEIKGNSRLSSKEILEMTRLRDGGNVLAMSLDFVEEAVARSPWVEEVSVKRVLPGKLEIGVREKTPVFWLLHGGSLHYADSWGRLIAPVKPGIFASLPALEVEAGAEDATSALPDLVKSLKESHLPLNMTSVSWVRLSSARGVEVYMEDSRLKLTVGLEDWLPNLSRLGRTLTDLSRRGELGEVREIKAQGANVWVEKTPAASG